MPEVHIDTSFRIAVPRANLMGEVFLALRDDGVL